MSAGPRSRALFAEAQRHLVGGVNSPVRAFAAVGGTPPIVVRGEGALVYSVDQRAYVDFISSFGPLILGHAHPEVVAAVVAAAARGTSFAATHEGEIELARRIKRLLPAIEKVRCVNSGTEAVQSALRLARGVTGRSLVVKFEGCYHGHVDALLVRAGSGLATFGLASSAGVTAAAAGDTLVLPLDDEAALEETFVRHGRQLAAVIVEPLPANHGLLPQRREFLRDLRRLCSAHGALLVFDEVITGLRVRGGSIGNQLGIQPDLYTLGKVIGGGLPVGAYGGPAELMDRLAPLGPVYQAGTLSGNPLAMAAGLRTLDVLERDEGWERLERLGAHLEATLAPALAGHRWRLVRHESVFWLARGADPAPVRRADAIDRGAGEAFAPLHAGLLERGFMLAPSAYEVGFLSLAHEPPLLDDFARAVAAVLDEVDR